MGTFESCGQSGRKPHAQKEHIDIHTVFMRQSTQSLQRFTQETSNTGRRHTMNTQLRPCYILSET
jgi:hypothetical protein